MFRSIVIGLLATTIHVYPHCQVPCGIYDDARQFTTMFEHIQTIETAIEAIQSLSKTTENSNQTTRWIITKDQHATDIQRIMGDYFLVQRIKPGNSTGYFSLLKQGHIVMRDAMHAKQSSHPQSATQLRASLEEFQQFYTK